MLHSMKRIGLGSLLCTALLVTGCFGTKFLLVDPATAKVDTAYVGDWIVKNKDAASTDTAGLVIRNIDGKSYYVETDDNGKADRYVGYTFPIGSATFGEIRELTDDGKIADGYVLMRIQLDGEKLTFRQLNDAFFKDKPVDSADALRKLIEANMENANMYAEKEELTATRLKK